MFGVSRLFPFVSFFFFSSFPTDACNCEHGVISDSTLVYTPVPDKRHTRLTLDDDGNCVFAAMVSLPERPLPDSRAYTDQQHTAADSAGMERWG